MRPYLVLLSVPFLLVILDVSIEAQDKNSQAGAPKIAFNPKRPIPEAPGDVRDIESLVKAPPGYTMTRRNNFYKKDANGKTVPGTDLYRWASSGHWSNYDEAEAGEYKLPELLREAPVVSSEQWFQSRRPEIVKIVETEVYGRVPDNVPKVVWEVTSNVNDGKTIKKTIVGKLIGSDGNPIPAAAGGVGKGGKGFGKGGNTITINLTLPAGLGKVPVFFGGLSQAECLSMGWGWGNVSAPVGTLISLTSPKDKDKPGDFWGNYRITAWCFSRALDYLETDADVDARYICISGHSTGGKQVLCTAAMDQRVFMVVPTSSGRLGTALIRRDIGETLDDLAQLFAQNYCPNIKKWVGRWNEMPFDSHFFIALVAPRLCYVTGGDAELWQDVRGEFLACVAVDPVYRLLGKKGLGATELPNAEEPIVTGELAFYMHKGGHVFTPAEHRSVIEWASRYVPTKKNKGGK